MSNAIKNGDEPASAIIIDNGENVCFGLTKREAFAMAAMQGIMASPHYIRFQADMGIAQAAVSAADELLKALNK